ncbi:hypothetical protein QQS21_007568 [Conoideocrella luteorostrata]|uniref:Sialidase domain-containing protein n=1 Tax=Conoideocrella luteorostrata TaxID=1105319 RepID=A0AAJ0FX96_9HYPO|nr:hypothetical protein QQS21_007568 [Conoideocrella luteorostrata]
MLRHITALFLGLLALPTLTLSSPIQNIAVAPSAGHTLVDINGIYMRATRLHDSSILGGYAAQDGPNHVLRVVKSTDDGSSWTQIGSVATSVSATHDLDNAFPLQLPSGRILFAFRNHDRTASGEYTYFRITVCYSDDNGYNWKFLSQVAERPAQGVNGLWEPFLRVSASGAAQVYYSSENSANDQDNLMKISTDNGASWSGPHVVSGEGVTSRDGMSAVAEIKGVEGDRNLICVFENTESGPFSVNYVVSHDDGLTWGGRTRLYTAKNGKDAGAPYVVNVGGTLVTSFMTNEDSLATSVDGGKMKVVTSADGGKNWGKLAITGEAGSHWPGMYSLDEGHLLALYRLDEKGLVSQKYQVHDEVVTLAT